MNLISIWWNTRKRKRELCRLNAAKAVCESYGYAVMQIVTVGDTDYIKAANGAQYMIGRKQ